MVGVADGHEADDVGHTETGHHPPRHLGRPLDVIAGPGRNLIGPEHHLLGNPASEEHAQLTFEPVPRVGVAVLLRERRGEPERASPRHDSDLVDRVEAGDPQSEDGMAGLVVGREPALLLGEDHAPALGAEHDLVLGHLEVLHRDPVGTAPGGQERRLVADVREVRPRESGRAAGDQRELDILLEGELLGVHGQDPLAALHVGRVDDDLPVEPPGPEERRIEDVGPVRGGEQDHPLVRLEPVHLDEELVQGLLPLIVPAPEPRTPVAPHRVDLIDEDDARRMGLALLEEVADARGADPDEHLHEVRARHLEEGSAGLAGHGLRHQRLPRPGRPHEEDALGQAPAEPGEAVRVLEKLDDLLELILRLFGARHVLEGHFRGVRRDEFRLGAPELEGAVAASLHRPEEPEPEEDQDHPRES